MRPSHALVLFALAVSGCSRLAGLPAVPDSVSRKDAGLEGLAAAAQTAKGLGEATDIAKLAAAFAASPTDLAVGNAFRMHVLRSKLDFLEEARSRGDRSPSFPPELQPEPWATLKKAAEASDAREIRVQLALASVDEMVLNPALEVKAPASIDSTRAFTVILAQDPYYVPALVGRGLNYLNRPRNLVWPEKPAPPANAASVDLAMAAAVGAKVGGASARVKGLILLLVGDAYAHEGSFGQARSFWTLAGEASGDAGVQRELAVRASWPEPEIPDRLEARLDERMAEMDAPVSDLSFLWNDDARGPW